MTRGIFTKLLFVLSIVVAFALTNDVWAASINIVAIGASNTAGKGVDIDEAWPAVLERMLKAKGHDAHVSVRAVNGLTSRQIMSYANSLPPGTQVVIYDLAVQNDRRAHISAAETKANGAEIARRARAQGVAAIRAPFGYPDAGRYEKQADGRHFTPKAHRQIAAKLVPKVIAAARHQH